MLVSVVITTKDRPNLLERALTSVLRQNYSSIEIVVVNDGGEKVKWSNDSRIIVVNNPVSKGGGFSRNIGVENSTGSIVFFLDDDDFWDPEKVSRQVSAFNKSQRIGLVYTGRNVVVDNSHEVIRVITPTECGILYPKILYENSIGVTSSVAIRRQIFIDAGKFDESIPCRQDYDLWIRVAKLCEISFCSEPLLFYRVSTVAGSQISNDCDKHLFAYKIILEKYKLEIESQGMIRAKKIKSNLMFAVAKAFRRNSYVGALPYILWSVALYPNIKSVALLLPKHVIGKYGIL